MEKESLMFLLQLNINSGLQLVYANKLVKILILTITLISFSTACIIGFDDTVGDSDEDMIILFNENKADFVRLVNLSRKDAHIMRIAPTFIWKNYSKSNSKEMISYEPDSDFPKEKWEMYRRLFEKLKLEKGLIRYEDPEKILFFPKGQKGYIFSKVELNPQKDSLDNIDPTQIKAGSGVYKKLEENWYLFYIPNH
jgi:hypothetical protein